MAGYHRFERVIYHPALTLKYVKPSLRPGLRTAVGTKVSPKATQRNLLKRRLREIWRSLPIPSGVAATIYVKPVALKMSFAELKTAVTKLVLPLTRE